MKKISFFLMLCLFTASVMAQTGSSCENAIEIKDEYSGTFNVGEYWFKSDTYQLPLTIYYYPSDTTAAAPEVYIDLTCEYDSDGNGIYDDPEVERMVGVAGNYGLSFPMKETMKREYDNDGMFRYRITYDVNYRNMLYSEGVNYPVPAYVRLVNKSNSSIEAVSRSVTTRCREYVNTLGMNTSLLYAPADSMTTYVWPVGEWVDKFYRLKWEGDGTMTIYVAADCDFAKSEALRVINLPYPDSNQPTIPYQRMQKSLATSWMSDQRAHQPDFYVRMYPSEEGILTIEEYSEVATINEAQFAGVKAIIDNTAKTITATLPQGVNRATVIKAAVKNAGENPVMTQDTSYIQFVAYNNEKPTVNAACSKLTFGANVYNISGIKASTATGDTEATLKSITIDGVALADFQTKTNKYTEVEVTTDLPVISCETTSPNAVYSISDFTEIPATVTITVTAQAGNTATYTLELISGRSDNNLLTSITLDGEELADFDQNTLNYRVEVIKIPEIAATAADPNATVKITPAKTIPGYALVEVTSERGNKRTYSVNFSADQTLVICSGLSTAVDTMQQISISASDNTPVYRFPIREMIGLNLRLESSSAVKAFMSTTCNFTVTPPSYEVCKQLELREEPGFSNFVYDMRAADEVLALARSSVDGNIYMRFIADEDADFTISTWTEDCRTKSNLIQIGDEINLNSISYSNLYKIAINDWLNKDINFIWSGTSRLHMFPANTCEFYLNKNNIHVINYHQLQANETLLVESTELQQWAQEGENGLVYMRFNTDGIGTLTTEVVTDYNQETGMSSVAPKNISVTQTDVNTFTLLAAQTTEIEIYNITGSLIQKMMLTANQTENLYLPAGLYIVHTPTENLKLLSK